MYSFVLSTVNQLGHMSAASWSYKPEFEEKLKVCFRVPRLFAVEPQYIERA